MVSVPHEDSTRGFYSRTAIGVTERCGAISVDVCRRRDTIRRYRPVPARTPRPSSESVAPSCVARPSVSFVTGRGDVDRRGARHHVVLLRADVIEQRRADPAQTIVSLFRWCLVAERARGRPGSQQDAIPGNDLHRGASVAARRHLGVTPRQGPRISIKTTARRSSVCEARYCNGLRRTGGTGGDVGGTGGVSGTSWTRTTTGGSTRRAASRRCLFADSSSSSHSSFGPSERGRGWPTGLAVRRRCSSSSCCRCARSLNRR